jgi:carboxypeptidase Taq
MCGVIKTKLTELKQRLREIEDLGNVLALLGWDQQTYMPAGGAAARGRQSALLQQITQEKLVDVEIGRLLDALEPWAAAQPYDSDDASLIRLTRRNYERAIKVPPALIGELTEHAAASYDAWIRARPNNDFAAVLPYLEKTLDLSRRVANCFPGYDHIADPLIDWADTDMKAESVRHLFAQLRAELVPLVEAIAARELPDDACLKQTFPQAAQRAFGEQIIRRYGYDFERGRQDDTTHPFMTKFSLGDVRITTRFVENDLSEGLFSTLHETGHALYEQGIAMRLEGTPLANGTSAGVHESQSRLWENLVGRSRSFWEHTYPELQSCFRAQLGNVPLDTFYRAINRVEPSLIRTAADEVTYNLHVMIRFDLELALLEGTLALQDLPEAWHARYQSDLGVHAPSDVDGVLQDVHWFAGIIGGVFQGYTLGNVMSALFFEQAQRDKPQIAAELASGEFSALHTWLVDNLYQHGSKFTPNELVERISGGPLTIDPYMNYLRSKFGEIYAL